MTSLDHFLAEMGEELVAVRRDLHAHPELGWNEHRTTTRIVEALTGVGLSPRTLPRGTGLVCDIGPTPPVVGLRADIDALPVVDAKAAAYRSTVDGVCHACGHDVHTTVLIGTAIYLARLAAAGGLPRGVRVMFQPAEEVMPGGAHELLDYGALDGLERMFALHCDPAIEVGRVGLRVGAVTSATDEVQVRLSGPGGHTARPFRTADLVSALGEMVSRVPGQLARRIDPRVGVNLVWGEVHAGSAANVIPQTGVATGTLRILDRSVWETVPNLLASVVRDVVAPYGVEVEISHTRGVPPVVNEAVPVAELHAAARAQLGDMAACGTEQSLGGEDFGWLLEKVPGALARLGVRTPGVLDAADLHRPTFDVDERCIGVGVRLLAGVCLGD